MENKRRRFLKIILSGIVGIGLLSSFKKKSKDEGIEKIKMLTSDGKLVEVSRSIIETGIATSCVTNKEMLDWMNTKPNNK